MQKLKIIFAVSMVGLYVFTGCESDAHKETLQDSALTGPAKDSTSSTKLPDTMYDNSNQDSIQ